MGSRGGVSWAKIVNLIHEKPCNIYQITEELNLNYKTVKHHLDILHKNQIVKCNKGVKYGAIYFLTSKMKRNYDIFDEIYKKLEK